MDKKTEALKLALESLVDNRHYIVANERTEYLEIYDKAIDAVEKALAEQQEPVAVIRSVVHSGDGGVRVTWLGGFPQIGDLLYTSLPAQCKPLTDEQIAQSLEQYSDVIDPSHEFWKGITRAIEAAHGIKGDA